MEKFSKSNVAREYRDKHGMEMPTQRLAKIMFSENKKLFYNVEDARDALRYIEGKKGRSLGSKIIRESKYFKAEERPRNVYNLPESDEIEYKTFKLKSTRTAIISDIHVPYHSVSALTTALDFIKAEKPDTILILGDLLDFYQLSNFNKDPRKRNFASEIQMACEVIKIIQDKIGAKVVYKFGNHSARYRNYIFQRAAALAGFEDFELETIIKKRIPEITIVDDKILIDANELTLLHGHEFGKSMFSPVNIARGLFLRGKSNAICGHHHRTSSHVERTLKEKMIATWSIGCLSELHPDYLPINNFNHGFAMLDLGKTTGFEVRNYSIYKGKVM